MVQHMEELKKQIMLKYDILHSVQPGSEGEKEKLREIEIELDSLLYAYYKCLKYTR